jgi:hypothetical protein
VNATAQRRGIASIVKPALLVLVALSLLGGIAGGLLRAGWPGASDSPWLAHGLVSHAALMVCGFFGTVIGIERAVALKRRFAFVAPICSGAAGLCLLAGVDAVARGLIVVAALAFTAVNIAIVRRQRAEHTVLLLVSALAWLVGSLFFAIDGSVPAALAWWFSFLVMTIAAERLEMTRLMRRRPAAVRSFHAIMGALIVGATLSAISPLVGTVLYGAALAALACWLAAFDIARRTVHATGLSRYMAVCLLGGYAWLLVAGLAWAAMAVGLPTRDIALHALGLGFVFSMVMGHAPVILPAVAGTKMQFGWPFYLPLALLHASLALRFAGDAFAPGLRMAAATLNAAALALFAATAIGGIVAWRWRHGPREAHRPAA